MQERLFKKIAGTSAVFIPAEFDHASPVERDGLVWNAAELSLPEAGAALRWKPALESTLALEGLEEYDPPSEGDARYVNKIGMAFTYIEKIRGWVALTHFV